MKNLIFLLLLTGCMAAINQASAQFKPVKAQAAATEKQIATVEELPDNFKPAASENVLLQSEGIFVYYTTATTNDGFELVLTKVININKKSKKLSYDGLVAGFHEDGSQILPIGGKKSGELSVKSGENKPGLSFKFSGAIPENIKAELIGVKVR